MINYEDLYVLLHLVINKQRNKNKEVVSPKLKKALWA